MAEPEIFRDLILEKHLPEKLGDNDALAISQKVISDNGATGIKDMGKVMGLSTKLVAGQADNENNPQI